MNGIRQTTAALVITPLLWCILAAGCAQFIDPNVPEPIRPCVEPELGRQYLLYRPSSYDSKYAWPLVIVCHSSFPDSPNRQIRAWTQSAESAGFLVAAPKLEGNRKSWPPKTPKQIALQRVDEEHVLSTIRHIRAAHNISDDRVFIHGFGGGAHCALHTGLRHPEIFRAVSLSQPGFDENNMADAAGAIDTHQSVFVHYNVADAITGKQAKHCIEWLRAQGAGLSQNPHAPADTTDAERVIQFFEEVLLRRPWIRIRVLAANDNPLTAQFKVQCSYKPSYYRWEFGDGNESPLPEPLHTYSSSGTYRVTLTVNDPNGTRLQRTAQLTMPEGTLATTNNPQN